MRPTIDVHLLGLYNPAVKRALAVECGFYKRLRHHPPRLDARPNKPSTRHEKSRVLHHIHVNLSPKGRHVKSSKGPNQKNNQPPPTHKHKRENTAMRCYFYLCFEDDKEMTGSKTQSTWNPPSLLSQAGSLARMTASQRGTRGLLKHPYPFVSLYSIRSSCKISSAETALYVRDC